MSDAHAAKKPKTTSTGPPLYSELDLAKLTVDATLLGSNETRFATVTPTRTRTDGLELRVPVPRPLHVQLVGVCCEQRRHS